MTKKLPVSTKKYPVKDIQLHVARMGRGPDLILVHGWSNNWFGWMRLAEALAPYYRLHMLDLPGFGDSDVLEENTVEILADYVHEYVKKYAPAPKALIGGSLGTFIVAQVAWKYQLKSKLILVGTVVKRDKIKLLATMYQKILKVSVKYRTSQQAFEYLIHHPYSAYVVERFINAYKFDKELVDTYQVPGRQKVHGKPYIQIGLSAMDFVIEDFLRQTKNQVLLLCGRADRYTNPTFVKQLVKELDRKNISYAIVDQAGHSPAYEQPQQTAAVIRQFLK